MACRGMEFWVPFRDFAEVLLLRLGEPVRFAAVFAFAPAFAGLAAEVFEAPDEVNPDALSALEGSLVVATVEISSGAAPLDFFELFAIYFCFRSAKPLRAESALASENGTNPASPPVLDLTMKHFVFRWAITTAAVMVAASMIEGIRYDNATSLVGAALLLGILNAFLRPILLLLMAPLIILTLGLFIFVVNALMLLLVNDLVHGFHVDSFGSAFWGAILISIVSWLLSAFFRGSDGRVHVLTHHTQMRRVEGRVVGSGKPGEP